MVYTELLLLYSLIGVGGNRMWFSLTSSPNLCTHKLGYNWALLSLWLPFKRQHYVCAQMVLPSVPKLLTLERKPPACQSAGMSCSN